ncbi:MAG: flagellar basal body P-ring formation protein FlgA [Sideroxydans sp.]|nr:flagellar basal body P-ring formation protein FlgA [Sideroxydans sp.]
MKKLLLIFTLLLPALPAWAAPQQSHNEIRQAITRFVRMQTQSLPGKVEIKVDEIDRRLQLNACPALETFLPPGGHLLGNGTVGVRCPKSGTVSGWTLYVPVHITVTATLLVTNRPLPRGKVMSPDDFSDQSGVITQADMLTDPAQVTGKILRYGVGAGQILRQSMLRDPYAVVQGQNVPVVVEGRGFHVRSEGKALNNAAEGENVQVRTASGRVVSGTAQENGEVVVRP